MRTTIDINDALLRQARSLMARQRTTLRALVEEGLRRVIEESRARPPFTLRDASVGEGGLTQAARDGSWEAMSTLLYQHDL